MTNPSEGLTPITTKKDKSNDIIEPGLGDSAVTLNSLSTQQEKLSLVSDISHLKTEKLAKSLVNSLDVIKVS